MSDFKALDGTSLADKMTKHDTVCAQNCDKCGNPWWFKHHDGSGECTMCANTCDVLECQICGAKAHGVSKQIDDRVVCAMCIEEKRYHR